jgi:TRAP-type C4-dicarboxylate transport system permease small subunit
MVIWGGDLVYITWHQVIGEFPIVTTGITYLPIPLGGGIMVLLIIERIWKGNLFPAVNASLGAME